jgi:hypothetical protein
MEKEQKLSSEEIQNELLTATKSIQKNIKFITWCLIISIVFSLYYLIKLFGATGVFRAY